MTFFSVWQPFFELNSRAWSFSCCTKQTLGYWHEAHKRQNDPLHDQGLDWRISLSLSVSLYVCARVLGVCTLRASEHVYYDQSTPTCYGWFEWFICQLVADKDYPHSLPFVMTDVLLYLSLRPSTPPPLLLCLHPTLHWLMLGYRARSQEFRIWIFQNSHVMGCVFWKKCILQSDWLCGQG